LMEVRVGVTTPLKPPHPVNTAERTTKTDSETIRWTFMFVNRPFRNASVVKIRI
jgi:hypothetical protein